ncbi:MAG TPA: GAF domain-containing protein, partial [Lachnospiraceae bacterium]|nr:GAF domain-containing protein [Lachnospiraceae bacterium]
MVEINELYPASKKEMYELLREQLQSLTEDEKHVIPNLANASALLNGALTEINWVGFYLMTEGYLMLGPFQGKTACIRIPIGRGVCGSAVSQNQSLLVADVHEFPGHIACDSASNSEIVIPIHKGDNVVGVLDIDSPIKNRF